MYVDLCTKHYVHTARTLGVILQKKNPDVTGYDSLATVFGINHRSVETLILGGIGYAPFESVICYYHGGRFL